ncbi:major facilitator superfamily domain-containing protein [Mycena amicta]|nr:major facilitator superfamily domain-containing protein [Mycena amicta]
MSRKDDWSPDVEVVDALDSDPLVSIFPSRSRSVGHRAEITIDENAPLLGDLPVRRKKPFYRARPLWLVPFAVIAALVRGMTLAPRVAVFTQLACSQIHHQNTLLQAAPIYHVNSPLLFLEPSRDDGNAGNRTQPAPRSCKSDPAVTARAAKIQATYAMTMGFLSALTTGWWGQFGDRYGRTKLLAVSTVGWFLTDVSFILSSSPGSPLAAHAHKLLLLAPAFEGFFGGWSTLQSTASAYISDCTSSGSRASVFSRFAGVEFLGFSAGPILGAWLIRHPIPLFSDSTNSGAQTVISVFWVAAIGSFINFCLSAFILPESVSKEKRERVNTPQEVVIAAIESIPKADSGILTPFVPSFVKTYLSPLRTFFPVKIPVSGTNKVRRDWSLTLLMCALFGYMLSAGLYQIKYLYGSHVYSWTPEQLSYYISFMGGGRALFLLVAFPLVISTFKPKSILPTPPPTANGVKIKPKPTKEHLAREIKFDLRLAKISLCIDIVANSAIVLAPAPSYTMHAHAIDGASDAQFRSSQALFVMASWTASWGAGLIPAIRSLALSIMQSRALLAAADGVEPQGVDTGKLFGALAILQAIGQMILGPPLFALIYSSTVATFPKAVFCTAIGILFLALSATLLVRSPLAKVKGTGKARETVRRRRRVSDPEEDEERGRSRASKDLRQHSAYGSVASGSEAGPSSMGSNSS